jgi:hypothetical protein
VKILGIAAGLGICLFIGHMANQRFLKRLEVAGRHNKTLLQQRGDNRNSFCD